MRIETARLDLVVLDREFLASTLVELPPPNLGFDPAGFLAGADDVIAVRIAQIDEDAHALPWLLRAIVLRAEHRAVGFINFHAPPDERGMVEIGYEVLPAYRRRGYAFEAVAALIAWAGTQHARIVRACVAPDNAASLALLRRGGFALTGEQMDEVDGRELVFERPI
jgi:RimJ/RimL family protein N-acetyltransferase